MDSEPDLDRNGYKLFCRIWIRIIWLRFWFGAETLWTINTVTSKTHCSGQCCGSVSSWIRFLAFLDPDLYIIGSPGSGSVCTYIRIQTQKLLIRTSVANPDPVGSVYYWLSWIRIWICILYTDPDLDPAAFKMIICNFFFTFFNF